MAGWCQACRTWQAELWLVMIAMMVATPLTAQAQLSSTFYDSSCPGLQAIVNGAFSTALNSDGRIGASLLRLHFHDCFVQGCDASVLLADTPSFTGEQGAGPNAGSLRGFNVIDNIKSAVESACFQTVSCADILALVARDAVVAAGGPSWTVLFGRRDSTTASFNGANNLPSPVSSVSTLTGQFGAMGLSQLDMVALLGAHTFGKARCLSFNNRLNNFGGVPGATDPSLSPSFLANLQAQCQGGPTTEVDLDVTTPGSFDNAYYQNLPQGEGLLSSDEELQTTIGSTTGFVTNFGGNQAAFFAQFAISIVSLGNLNPLTGSAGEIRTVCSKIN